MTLPNRACSLYALFLGAIVGSFLLGFFVRGKQSSHVRPVSPVEDADALDRRKSLDEIRLEYQRRPNAENALALLQSLAIEAPDLVRAGRFEAAIEALNEGVALEERYGVAGGEERTASFAVGHLIDQSITQDASFVLAYLRSPNVSLKEKTGVLQFLRDGVLGSEKACSAEEASSAVRRTERRDEKNLKVRTRGTVPDTHK